MQLNSFQMAVIDAHVRENIRVRATAGSGKTTVMTERYCRLVASGIAPENILVVTFSNAGAEPIRDRIAQRVRLSSTAASQISTTHAACYRLLKADGCRLTIPDTKWKVTKEVKAIAAELWPDAQTRPAVDELLVYIDAPKHRGLTSADDLEFYEDVLNGYAERGYVVDQFEWPKLLHRARAKFDKVCQQQGWLTFADQLYLVERRLIEDAEWRTAQQAHFQHVLVDEGQDNAAQDLRILGTFSLEPGDNAIYDAYNPRTGRFE